MEAAPTIVSPNVGAPARGGFRGRGGGISMRGSYERGRGRGIGRGHYLGGLGRGGGPGGIGGGPPQGVMTSGRGTRSRGGQGYQGRGGFSQRGGPPMRGGRPPLYIQPTKQHTGAENNKTVSPVPAASGNAIPAASEGTTAASPVSATNGGSAVASAPHDSVVTISANGSIGGAPRGHARGRGNSFFRNGGRGGYNPHINGMHGAHSVPEHGQMSIRRGGPPRGRGALIRSPMHQPHSANMQIAPVQSLKRGAPGGPPFPKRGRYEGGPYSQRPMAPKYHQPPQHVAPMTSQPNYGVPPSHHQQSQSHHGYPSHEQQAQAVDPYAQSYATPTAQSYNGYGQNTGYSSPTPQASSSYAVHHSAGEYDQSQYQGYNSSTYTNQQDARYQSYGQDYTQQYGAPAVDYNSTPQADYSQHHAQQAYDDRAYTGYDTHAYQQSYSNATGYY